MRMRMRPLISGSRRLSAGRSAGRTLPGRPLSVAAPADTAAGVCVFCGARLRPKWRAHANQPPAYRIVSSCTTICGRADLDQAEKPAAALKAAEAGR